MMLTSQLALINKLMEMISSEVNEVEMDLCCLKLFVYTLCNNISNNYILVINSVSFTNFVNYS